MKKKLIAILLMVITILGLSSYFIQKDTAIAYSTYGGVWNVSYAKDSNGKWTIGGLCQKSWDQVKNLKYQNNISMYIGLTHYNNSSGGINWNSSPCNMNCFHKNYVEYKSTDYTEVRLRAVIDIDKDGYVTVTTKSGTQKSSSPAYATEVNGNSPGRMIDDAEIASMNTFWWYWHNGFGSAVLNLGNIPYFYGNNKPYGLNTKYDAVSTAKKYQDGTLTDTVYYGKVFLFYGQGDRIRSAR